MIGYTCAMLRYYYPLNLSRRSLITHVQMMILVVRLNLRRIKGFIVRAPKFGHAQNIYVCDKETNTIYKGLGSIKSMQNIAADIMDKLPNYIPEMFGYISCYEMKSKWMENVSIPNPWISLLTLDSSVNLGT